MLCRRKAILQRWAFSAAGTLPLRRIRRCDLFEQCKGVLTARFAQSVVRPLALLTALDNAGFTEDLHVVGDSGLPHSQGFNQHTGTFLTAAEQFQNRQPLLVTQGLEHLCVSLMGGLQSSHLTSKIFDVNSIYKYRRFVNIHRRA